MSNQHLYEVDLQWKLDREGSLSSPVLDNTIEVVTPPEFPKGIAGKWSPEHLFVASVSSCMMTTFLAIAENSGFEFQDLTINAVGKLERVDKKFIITEIQLNPVLTINDQSKSEKGLRILEKSEAACLISNSITSKIKLTIEIIVREESVQY
ncbi:MAG: OsmC family protein [Balneolaceae bacterium]